MKPPPAPPPPPTLVPVSGTFGGLLKVGHSLGCVPTSPLWLATSSTPATVIEVLATSTSGLLPITFVPPPGTVMVSPTTKHAAGCGAAHPIGCTLRQGVPPSVSIVPGSVMVPLGGEAEVKQACQPAGP